MEISSVRHNYFLMAFVRHSAAGTDAREEELQMDRLGYRPKDKVQRIQPVAGIDSYKGRVLDVTG